MSPPYATGRPQGPTLDALRRPGFKPILRKDLKFWGESPQVLVVQDPATGTSYRLYYSECMLAQEMDGGYDLEGLVERAQLYVRGQVARYEIEQLVMQFAGLGLISNMPTAAAAKLLKPRPVAGTGIEYVVFREQLLEDLKAEAAKGSAELPSQPFANGHQEDGTYVEEGPPDDGPTIAGALDAKVMVSDPVMAAQSRTMTKPAPSRSRSSRHDDEDIDPVATIGDGPMPTLGDAPVDDELSSQLASLKVSVAPPKKSWGGTIFTLLLLAGLGGGGYFAYTKYKSQIFAVTVELSEIASVSSTVESTLLTATGYVVPEAKSSVGARVSGRVAKVLVKEGDMVKAGDVIAKLDDSDQKSQIQIAVSRMNAAAARAKTSRASVSELNTQIRRETTLVEKKLSPRATLEDLRARQNSLVDGAKASEAEVGAARAEVQALRVNLEHMTITAPIGGTITSKPVSVGELVGPQGRPVAEIADFSTLVVEVDVPERGLGQIKPGSPAEITLDAFASKRYQGEMKEFGQKIDRAKGTASVKVKFIDTPERVLPEMAARVSFLNTKQTKEALNEAPKKMVSASAVVERGGQKVIFTIVEGKAKQVAVKVGPKQGESYVILEGPDAGTKVITPVTDKVLDGVAVKEKGN
jgi:RND family efflux transporter MFP subunit